MFDFIALPLKTKDERYATFPQYFVFLICFFFFASPFISLPSINLCITLNHKHSVLI